MQCENGLLETIADRISEQDVLSNKYSLLENVSNSIWHAFHSLDVNKNGRVGKNKLKVLASSMGSLLNVFGIEKGLEDYSDLPNLSFEQFKNYLRGELFVSLPSELGNEHKRQLECYVDEMCWLVCKHVLLMRDHPILPETAVFNLFRLFCLLAQDEPHSQFGIVVVMNSEEVGHVIQNLVQSIGKEWDQQDFLELSQAILDFTFSVFLSLLEHHYLLDADRKGICEAIDDICDSLVRGVLKKAASCCCLPDSPQRLQIQRRKLERSQAQLQAYLEMEKRKSQLSSMEQTLAELQAEKQARACAEREAHQLVLQQDEERQKLQDLLNIRSSLEKLLEEKKQALQDEEIVRTLQARVLSEEWEKREELEKQQEQQKQLLEQERRKRELYEQMQQEKEAQLREAQQKLKLLEEDRQRLDEELREARQKILHSEKAQMVKLKTQENCFVRHGSWRESAPRREVPRRSSVDDMDVKLLVDNSLLWCGKHPSLQ